jgi:hypothetical protein
MFQAQQVKYGVVFGMSFSLGSKRSARPLAADVEVEMAFFHQNPM